MKRYCRSGFSLSEIIVAIGIGALLTGAFLGLHHYFVRIYNQGTTYIRLRNELLKVVDFVSTDIRRAGEGVSFDPAEVIVTANSTQFSFKRELSGSAAGADTIKYVYSTQDEALYRDVAYDGSASSVRTSVFPTKEVAVNQCNFYYYDENGNELVPAGNPPSLSSTDIKALRRVDLSIGIQNKKGEVLNQRFSISLNNFNLPIETGY